MCYLQPFALSRFSARAAFIASLIALSAHSFALYAQAAGPVQTSIALRMVGHELLLSTGDSTSRVMPVVQEEPQRYRLSFAAPFAFEPGRLAAVVEASAQKAGLTGPYLVEVAVCGEQEAVYGFKVGQSEASDIIPCQDRLLPEDCYALLFTFPETGYSTAAVKGASTAGNFAKALLPLALALMGWLYWRGRPIKGLFGFYTSGGVRSKSETSARSSLTAGAAAAEPNLGNFHFDPEQLLLAFKGQRTELTGKEAALLQVLHASPNQTLERDVLLQAVWGDEGGYVGRTLDVFISRLRKKLSADPEVKIVNIRGVGYRLQAPAVPPIGFPGSAPD